MRREKGKLSDGISLNICVNSVDSGSIAQAKLDLSDLQNFC